jgi:hypothetical protein
MQAVAKGEELTARNSKSMSTICNCERGVAKITPAENNRRAWTEAHVYDPLKHCLCPHADTSDDTELREFIATLEQRRVESMPNFSEELAAYTKGTD